VPLTDKLLGYVTDTFLFGQRGDLNAETMLLDKGIVDSTGVLELVTFVEEECGIKVADADLVPENFGSVARLVAYVERKKAA
jgi:acyl carrier protein